MKIANKPTLILKFTQKVLTILFKTKILIFRKMKLYKNVDIVRWLTLDIELIFKGKREKEKKKIKKNKVN